MSKIRHDNPANEEVHHDRGELRKPEDRADQPEQGGAYSTTHDDDRDPDPTRTD